MVHIDREFISNSPKRELVGVCDLLRPKGNCSKKRDVGDSFPALQRGPYLVTLNRFPDPVLSATDMVAREWLKSTFHCPGLSRRGETPHDDPNTPWDTSVGLSVRVVVCTGGCPGMVLLEPPTKTVG